MVKLTVKQVPNIKEDLKALAEPTPISLQCSVCGFTETVMTHGTDEVAWKYMRLIKGIVYCHNHKPIDEDKPVKAQKPDTSEAKIRLQLIRNRLAALKMNGKVTTLKELDEILKML